jgi:hypothetical protein
MFVGQCVSAMETVFQWGAEHVIIVGVQVRFDLLLPSLYS